MAAPGSWDAKKMPLRGVAAHGNTPFDTKLISEIVPGLWLGGVKNGVHLPQEIEFVVSLYPWENYEAHDNVKGVLQLMLLDAELTPDALKLFELAAKTVNVFSQYGPTLVHCQAGLNRSSFTLALALANGGHMTTERAVKLIREKRSPACLCNPDFEEYLLGR